MNIPENIIKINKTPLDNFYFYKANEAFEKLSAVKESGYFDDLMASAINTLERYYKGFLCSADEYDENYYLPRHDFLTKDHDLIKLVREIQKNYPEVFPYQSRNEWNETSNFLRDMRHAYTAVRYNENSSYQDFKKLLSYIEIQKERITDYIKTKGFNAEMESEFVEDL